jgi:hypothetical protein
MRPRSRPPVRRSITSSSSSRRTGPSTRCSVRSRAPTARPKDRRATARRCRWLMRPTGSRMPATASPTASRRSTAGRWTASARSGSCSITTRTSRTTGATHGPSPWPTGSSRRSTDRRGSSICGRSRHSPTGSSTTSDRASSGRDVASSATTRSSSRIPSPRWIGPNRRRSSRSRSRARPGRSRSSSSSTRRGGRARTSRCCPTGSRRQGSAGRSTAARTSGCSRCGWSATYASARCTATSCPGPTS